MLSKEVHFMSFYFLVFGRPNSGKRHCATRGNFSRVNYFLIAQRTFVGGDSWYFRLVSSLQRSLWNKKQFVNHVNQLYQNELLHVNWLGWNKVSCNQKELLSLCSQVGCIVFSPGLLNLFSHDHYLLRHQKTSWSAKMMTCKFGVHGVTT